MKIQITLFQKLVLLGVLPMIILTIFLIYFNASSRLNDIEAFSKDKVQAIAELIAIDNVGTLFARNRVELKNHLNDYLQAYDELIAVKVYTEDYELSEKAEKAELSNKDAIQHRARITLSQKINTLSDIDLGEPGNETETTRVLGYVEVKIIDKSSVYKEEVFQVSVIILIFAIAFTLMFVIPFSRQITKPVIELTRLMRRMTQGDLSGRASEDASDEFFELQRGYNEMIFAMSRQTEELSEMVDQMTSDLQTTLQTVEIQNVELDITRREALQTSRIKSEFLANMSHEIRTPMNAIVGYAELLRKSQSIDNQDRNNAEIISRSARILLQILNDILDFSKLDAGKIEIVENSFNLRDCITEIMEFYRSLAHAKHLDLIALVYDDIPVSIKTDRLRVIQVIGNLLNNAIKFTQQGEIIVKVMLDEDETSGTNQIRFDITDQGVGISENGQKTLFQPFKQINNESRGHSGTGLGLYISKSLADMMGGDIEVKSELGKGSTFSLLLPLLSLAADNSNEMNGSEPLFHDMRGVLADSNRLSRLAVHHQLIQIGFKITDTDQINDITPIINTGQTDKANIVFIGCSYHQLDEFEKFYNQNLALFDDLPVVLMISSSDENILKRLQTDYGIVVVSRPCGHQELTRACKKALHINSKQSLKDTNAEQNKIEILSNKKILVVDDNEINRNMMMQTLSQIGCKIDTANNGLEALSACKNNDYDLVLMDIHMPVMNGIEATEQLRKTNKDIPVIALTADVSFRSHLIENKGEFNGILIKPVELGIMQNKLVDFFKGDENIFDLIPTSSPTQTKDSEDSIAPIRDMDQALRISGGSEQVAKQLFKQMIDLLPDYLQKIDLYSSKQEWDELWQSLHKLHGAASVCGVPALNNAINSLQKKVKNADYFSVEMGIETIKTEAYRLIDYAKQEDI